MGKTECGTPEEAPATRARPEAYPRSEAPEAPDFHYQWTEARTQNARLEAAIVVLKTKVADLTAQNAVLTAKIRQAELAPEKIALSNWVHAVNNLLAAPNRPDRRTGPAQSPSTRGPRRAPSREGNGAHTALN